MQLPSSRYSVVRVRDGVPFGERDTADKLAPQ
jgi:hypothetical protein